MAWAYVQTIEGGSLDEYDKVTAAMGDIGMPDGLIVHAVGRIEDGFRIIDVWESREQYERFRDETLAPAFERAFGGLPVSNQTFEPMDVYHLVK
jgi:hypothetical protein